MPTCLTCEQEIPYKEQSGRTTRRPKYCNRVCYANRERTTRIIGVREILKDYPIYCCQCGEKFIRSRCDQVTCSKKCLVRRHDHLEHIQLRLERKAAISKPVKCENCRGKFVRSRANQIHCSMKCSHDYSHGSEKAKKEIGKLAENRANINLE